MGVHPLKCPRPPSSSGPGGMRRRIPMQIFFTLLPTMSSRRTWKACFSVASWLRPPVCGLPCVKLITSPLIQWGWGFRGFHHSEDRLVWNRIVGGAMNILVDSNSPGLAPGTAQLYWLCPGATRGMLGSPTMIAWARRSWTCYSSSLCGRTGLPGTSRPTTSMVWSPSSSTTSTAWLTSPSFGQRGGPGNPHSEDGETLRWCPSRLTWWRGEHHEPGQCGHYGAGLVPWRLGRNPCHHARPADFRHLSSVRDASLPSAVPVHPPSVQDVTPSCIETQLLHLRPSDIVLLPGDTEVSSAVSGPAHTLRTLAAVVSGVAMAYHPGAYAVQAAGEAPPCAETAMERVASTRVEQWRSQWGLHDDTDFAYAFASYDSAVAHGGHHVADAWLQARSKTIDEDLIPQAAAVAESSGSTDRPPTWPAPKASMLKRSKMVQALRLRPAPDSRPARASSVAGGGTEEGLFSGQGHATSRGADPGEVRPVAGRPGYFGKAQGDRGRRGHGGECPQVLGGAAHLYGAEGPLVPSGCIGPLWLLAEWHSRALQGVPLPEVVFKAWSAPMGLQ